MEIPEEAGNVDPAPPGEWYDEDFLVDVKATPEAWYAFIQWSGDLGGTESPDTVLMDRPKRICANFGNYPPLFSVPDTSFAEDDTLMISMRSVFDWIADANNPDTTLSIDAGCENILVVLHDSTSGIFKIYASLVNWTGVDTIVFSASDPLGATGYGNMAVTVTPVSDPPGPFSLLGPRRE